MLLVHCGRSYTPSSISTVPLNLSLHTLGVRTKRRMSVTVREEEIDFLESQVGRFRIAEIDQL